MNLQNLKNWKTYVGLTIAALFLVAAFVLHVKGGFVNNFLAAVGYVTSGAVLGLGVYYIFLEEKSY
jgi:hypothetical protein